MRELISVLAAFLVALGATRSYAGEHLAPEETIVAGYEEAVAKQLTNAFTPDVRARAIVEPSFAPEFAVGLKEKDGKFHVFYTELSNQVWPAFISSGGHSKAGATRAKECSILIDPQFGASIVAGWKLVLSRVKPQPPDNGFDGEFYHFSMTAEGHALSGQTWCPPRASEAGMMVDIVYAIRDACEKNDPNELGVIPRLLNGLEKYQ